MKKLFLYAIIPVILGTSSVALADTTSVLLIPLRTSNVASNMGEFDPYDGHFLGWFYTDSVNFRDVAYDANSGPDGNVYVSIQTQGGGSHIEVFDSLGHHLYTYADSSDDVRSIRGIAFRGDTLFVPNSATSRCRIQMFDGPHNLLEDFIVDSLMSMWDMLFLEDGRALVSRLSAKTIRLYNADGTPSGDVLSTSDSPSQIQVDPQLPGAFLEVDFSPNTIGYIYDFDLDGTIQNLLGPYNYAFGIYRLGNGNLLMTSGAGTVGGVYEITNAGDTVDVEFSGMRSYSIGLCTIANRIEVGPDTLSYTLDPDTIVAYADQIVVANLGSTWMQVDSIKCDIAFATVGSCLTMLAPGQSDSIDITLNTTGITPGDYSGACHVYSKDPVTPIVGHPWLNVTVTGGPVGCVYVPGDLNGIGGANGIDVTYGVTYLKGGTAPHDTCFNCPNPGDTLLAPMDVNGSCSANGIDITFFVAYLKLIQPALLYCADCPPPPPVASVISRPEQAGR